ncbi:hypothetical protein CDAR_387641 [Caerostris darwini]|uniref:Uncharacterized protein n=1 Tax=Caerostris darwini TaxID=1538125 RepID=A0AAV4TJC9_9ARAC|nr:hypothetical protein CDAR_387641 [Caerostris darwini]
MERLSLLTPELSSVHWGWGAATFDTEDGLQCERAEGEKGEGVHDSWGGELKFRLLCYTAPFPSEMQPPSSRSIKKGNEGENLFRAFLSIEKKFCPLMRREKIMRKVKRKCSSAHSIHFETNEVGSV